MGCEWIKATSQDTGKAIYINIEKAAVIEDQKKGARIWFTPGDKASTVDIVETAEEILGSAGEIEIPEED